MIFKEGDRVVTKGTNSHGCVLSVTHTVGTCYYVQFDHPNKREFVSEKNLMREEILNNEKENKNNG